MVTTSSVAFLLGAAVSLATSWLLVSRIERICRRFKVSEAILGLIAALAADAPEITSATSALLHHQHAIGTGVVLGSNVFNFAALLGVGAIVAGRIELHWRVVLLTGVVSAWTALIGLLVILHVLSAGAGIVLVTVVIAPYVALSAAHGRLPSGFPRNAARWLLVAIRQEEIELHETISSRRAHRLDFSVGVFALAAVVVASTAMERAGAKLGAHFEVPGIVVGAIVLAAVTSVPNAVAGVYLARRRRGAATLSTAFNSNALNLAAGLLIPAAVLGVGARNDDAALVAIWYLAMTGLLALTALSRRGITRPVGALIVASYLVFLGVLVAVA